MSMKYCPVRYTAASRTDARLRATARFNARLEVAKRGEPVVVTSRCCHALPAQRDATVAADPDRWIAAERDALARIAHWARLRGYAVNILDHAPVNTATKETTHGVASCNAYSSVIVRPLAAA